MSYEDNYDQTARWDAESVREAEQRTQHRSTRSSAERQKLKKKGQRRRFTLWLAFVLITSAILAGVGWLLANDMCSFNKAPVETTIEITRDDNLNTIATKLHDEGSSSTSGSLRRSASSATRRAASASAPTPSTATWTTMRSSTA